MSQTFLQAVNRVLVTGGVIRADTGLITSFSGLQHGATVNMAIVAIQSCLIDLSTYYDLPYERKSATITAIGGTMNYLLAADFMNFWNEPAFLYDAVQNNHIFEYEGGEKKLSQDIFNYTQQSGYPNAWFYVDGTTKQLGFWPVPDANTSGRVFQYDYEADCIPLIETDVMPFIRNIEVFKFCDLATVKFNSLFTQQAKAPTADVEHDPTYISARADLLKLLRPTKPKKHYGRHYY